MAYGDVGAFPISSCRCRSDHVYRRGAFPDIKRVADVGRTTVYGDVGLSPISRCRCRSDHGLRRWPSPISSVADVGRTTVYGDVSTFPISSVADVGRTTVYGDVDTFPISSVADVGVRPHDVTTVYTATELAGDSVVLWLTVAGVRPRPIQSAGMK